MSEHEITPGGGQMPPPGPDQSTYQNPPIVPVPGPAMREADQRDQEQQRTRTRVAVTVAALVATVGAVVFGVAITNGHHDNKPTTSAAGAKPNAVVDPPSSSAGASGSASRVALPTLTGIPPAPSALSSASAMASAQAALQAFAPPSKVPANVPGYSASAPLNAVELPPFLTVTIPSVTAKDQGAQSLADESELLLKAWVEAWTSGNVADPRYDTLCVEQCRAVLDPTVTLWHKANIVPAGTIRFFEFAGGLAKANSQSGEVGVCLDDSAATAFRNGTTYQNPYPLGAPELLVFGLIYDKQVEHWVATEAYTSPGDSYCTSGSGGTSG